MGSLRLQAVEMIADSALQTKKGPSQSPATWMHAGWKSIAAKIDVASMEECNAPAAGLP